MNSPVPKYYIEPPSRWPSVGFAELWAYRDLLSILVWRDIKVRYKQTALGAAWAVLQPVFMMIVFTLFFGRLAKVPSNGLPYSLFAFAGLTPIGGLLAGWLAEVGGTELAFGVAGVCGLTVTAFAATRLRSARTLRRRAPVVAVAEEQRAV